MGVYLTTNFFHLNQTGVNIQKYSAMREQEKKLSEQRNYCSQPYVLEWTISGNNLNKQHLD